MGVHNGKGSRNKNLDISNPNSLKALYADQSMGARDARAQLFSFDKKKLNDNSSKRENADTNKVPYQL